MGHDVVCAYGHGAWGDAPLGPLPVWTPAPPTSLGLDVADARPASSLGLTVRRPCSPTPLLHPLACAAPAQPAPQGVSTHFTCFTGTKVPVLTLLSRAPSARD